MRIWLDGKRFSTKLSELGHSAERHALAAANAPGKAFVPHAQRDLLAKHRISHLALGGKDPNEQVKMRGGRDDAVPVPTKEPLAALLPPAVYAEVRRPMDREFHNT